MGRTRVLRAALCAAGMAIAAGGVAAGAGIPPAGASVASVPGIVPGTYVVELQWDGGGWNSFDMTLAGNHTASDSYGDSGAWVKVGKTVTITWARGIAVYTGTKNQKGFDTAKHPGTASNNVGDVGVWYATIARPG